MFAAVFNHSPIGHYLLSPTPEAAVLAVNEAFLKASGRRREELEGVSLFVAFPRNPADTGETDLRRSLARVVATGQLDRLPAQRYPIPVVLPNGEPGFEERFWSAVSTPIFDADGRIVCISHMTVDVTEQVRSEAALRGSDARYRAPANATADVIYRMNPDWSQMRQLDGRGFLKDSPDTRRYWLDDYVPAEEQQRSMRRLPRRSAPRPRSSSGTARAASTARWNGQARWRRRPAGAMISRASARRHRCR